MISVFFLGVSEYGEIGTVLRTTSGKTLEGGETEFSLTTVSDQKAVELNEDYYMTAPQIVASAIKGTSPYRIKIFWFGSIKCEACLTACPVPSCSS